jgi:hypothetical protein
MTSSSSMILKSRRDLKEISDQNLFRGLWRGSGSSGFFGLSRLFGSTNERAKTVPRVASRIFNWTSKCLGAYRKIVGAVTLGKERCL